MRHLFFLSFLASNLISCLHDNEQASFAVDYLDASNNGYDLQITFPHKVEMFQNDVYPIDVSRPDICAGTYLHRWVLPKNGGLGFTDNQIIYVPNKGFHGTDSIQFELCCNNKCNVYSMKFVVWKDNEERCESLLTNHFYFGYSAFDPMSQTVKAFLWPPPNCEFIDSLIITKNPKFGSVTVRGKFEIYYEGDLPKNTSDTVLYSLKITINENTQEKLKTWVIERNEH
jgi:hypothetical protein